MIKHTLLAGSLGLVLLTGSAKAVITVYPTPGVANPITYTFIATGTGPVTAYFVGHSAAFGSDIGLSINGAAPASFGLYNQTTPVGTSFLMGNVTAGDTLRFVLRVNTGGGDPPPFDYALNSDASLNPAGENHVYSYAYGGGDVGFPASGTYVGFEDISPLADGDRDYDDHQFIFEGVRATPTPEGGLTFILLGMAMAGLGLFRRILR